MCPSGLDVQTDKLQIFYHLEKIIEYVAFRKSQELSELALSAGDFSHAGMGFNSQGSHLPYSQTAPWAMQRDFDHDGIPDALDDHIGPGAQTNPPSGLPYTQTAPWAMQKDFDHDGIPDALDDHIGHGAQMNPPSGLPYTQTAPWAMQRDFDHDGIPDALDDHVGPGSS